MAVKRPTLTAIAELYVAFDLNQHDMARAVSFRRKVPRTCETCGHEASMHYHPSGWCMSVDEEKDEDCECVAMFAHGREWRIL